MNKRVQLSLLLTIVGLFLATSVWGDAIPSGELFATYQKFGDTFYEGGSEANLEATSHYWNVNYYIVTCGDSVLLRATTTEDRNLENGWPTQLRIWTGTYNNGNEIQVNAGDNKNRYTFECKRITPFAENVKIHMFLNWVANSTTQTFTFNRASINNPIEDNTAPTIDPEEVTLTEVDGKMIFTFGDVTADDQYFYYVADKEHNVGSISLTNRVTIVKPTIEDGTTYKFKCYAVDYNGNKSAYKEFTLVMPFDPELNLAYGKSCTAGAVQDNNTAGKAVDGNVSSIWTCFGQGTESDWWWQVDLGNHYDITQIKVIFNDCWNTYGIYSSTDNTVWTPVVENEPSASNQTKTYSSLNFSGRYLKVISSVSQIGIKEFEVYASGVSVADDTDPEVIVTEISKTVNSVTLQIDATDKDDAGDDGTINAINISGDNDFVTQNNVTLDGSNQITLSGLKDNTTYTFTVTAIDLAGNSTSENIVVELPFNTNLNLALNKTDIDGGYCQFSDHTPEGDAQQYPKANDGNAGTSYSAYGATSTDDAWWQVNLEAAYDIVEIKVNWASDYSTGYAFYGSLDGTNWYLIGKDAATAAGEKSTTVAATAQYLKVHSYNKKDIVIREVEVYASGFSTLTDSKPVVTYAKVGEVTDATAEIEIDAVDITTMPITTYMVSGLGGDAQEFTASEGKINLTSLSHSTNYSVSIQAKDGNGNLSDAKDLAFTTAGSVSGLYCFASFFGWQPMVQERARFTTTAEPGVLTLVVSNVAAGDQNFKLYNADADRCTGGNCAGPSDHHFNLASATDVTFYATDEDHFVCTADNLYLRGTLVGEDKALVWNDAHTKATWSGAVDLSGTKQYTLVKNNGNSFIYDNDIYDAAQTYDGELTDVTFTFDATKMTGTWSEHAYPVTLDETIDNSTTISNNNGRLADVTLARGFVADGGNYTLCLPFAMTAEQCAEAFHDGYQLWYLEDSRLKDNGDIYLNFISADNIVAGRPYLFCPAENVASGTVISNVQIDSEASKVSSSTYASFIGTYDVIAYNVIANTTNAYLLGSDNWLFEASELNPEYNLKALRAYFTLNFQSLSVQGRRPRAMVVFNEPRTDMPTDVEDAEQIVAPAKRIVNGQLIIEKNGVLYNAQGQVIR